MLNTNHHTEPLKQYPTNFLLMVLFILLLVIAPMALDSSSVNNVQPELLALAAEQPDARVDIIVQKAVADESAEAMVQQLGGAVTKRLNLINGFAAELLAENVIPLAQSNGVRWVSLDAPVVRVSGGNSDTVRDEFNNNSFSNNDGSINWAGQWEESGEDDGPKKGNLRIKKDQLRIGEENRSISRMVDLSNARPATLSFEYRRSKLDRSSDYIVLEISADGGGSWVELDRFTGPGNDSAMQPVSYDISNYASNNTIIRFATSSSLGEKDYLYIDNIQIAYSTDPPTNVFVEAIGAMPLWSESPAIKGKHVTVAVVDSGIGTHKDLQDETGVSFRIAAEKDFINPDNATPDDAYGHGTHVAGIIAGNGKHTEAGYYGVAPKAKLVDVRVINQDGVGTVSDVVAGLQWIYENKDEYNIRVVNLSLNSTVAESYNDSPLDAAVEILWFNGIVVVVSTGNNGSSDDGVLYPPANDPFVIAVGAVDDQATAVISDDLLAAYSAYGTTIDGYTKPDLVAPGSNIISLLADDNSNLALEHPNNVIVSSSGSEYFRMSGTSMSSAVVAGAIAQLLQDEPNLTPDQVKYRLIHTARTDWPGYDPQRAGAGYLDIYSAVHGVTTESANEGVTPHALLAKMALIAYWANQNDEEDIDWENIDWNTVNWDAVNWDTVDWSSVNWGSVNWGSVNWGSVNWGSVNWGSVNWGSANSGSVDWNP